MAATRRGRRGGHAEEGHSNHERWLLTYADMITLLMVLFIVLFAISQVDQKKFATLADGLARAFGSSNHVLDGQTALLSGARTAAGESQVDSAIPERMPVQPAQPSAERERLDAARRQILAALTAAGLQDHVRFELDRRGLVVTIVTDHVLFPVGSAELSPIGRRVLDAIGPALAALPNQVIVEGHTDDVPITGRYPSNWELSADRATHVLRYLLESTGVPARRLSSAGYADQRPRVPNDSAAHRARNRRVQVVVVARDGQAPPGTAQQGGIAPRLAPTITPLSTTRDPGTGG